MNYRQARLRAEILKALAHPVRVMLVHELQKGERCVCELQPLFSINQSNLSRHLTVLKRAGILGDRRDGMKVYYRLLTPCILTAFDCAVDVIRQSRVRQDRLTAAL